jgi:nucleotide-binding universal stress UspA family protein
MTSAGPPRTLVLPLDGSAFAERALPLAAQLAQRLGAGLLLVSARWDPHPDTVREYLDRVATWADVGPVDIFITDDRRPADAIANAAASGPDRIVCMSTHGRGRFRWAVVGSVAEGVLRTQRDPILLVGRSCLLDLPAGRRMVVCVDGSPVSEQVVGPAGAWAAALGLGVTLAFVGHPLDVEDAQRPGAVLEGPAGKLRRAGVEVEAEFLRSGYPAGAIADLAADLESPVIAMTTHARSGVPRVTLGSVTTAVTNTAPCPVLAVPITPTP